MKRKKKMNGLYKAAFILLLICIVMFITAILVAYVFEKPVFSAAFSGGGAFLAFLGIIFATVSKPKKVKKHQPEEEALEPVENIVDNI